MYTVAEVKIYCLACCEKNQTHKLVYVGRPEKGAIYLKKAICLECENVLSMDRLGILESYLRKIPERILTKPCRVMEEVEEHPFLFLKDWPIRYLTKPYRIAREILEIVNR